MQLHELRPSERVVEAVASYESVDPTDLRPLYEFVDPDALDALVESLGDGGPAMCGSVQFDYAASTVSIRTDGTVEVGKSPYDAERTTDAE